MAGILTDQVSGDVDDGSHATPEAVDPSAGNHFLADDDDGCGEPAAKWIKADSAETFDSSAAWVQCDKCQRTIRFDDFSSHYRDVHADASNDSKNSQVN
jgi:hypothetical protein